MHQFAVEAVADLVAVLEARTLVRRQIDRLQNEYHVLSFRADVQMDRGSHHLAYVHRSRQMRFRIVRGAQRDVFRTYAERDLLRLDALVLGLKKPAYTERARNNLFQK